MKKQLLVIGLLLLPFINYGQIHSKTNKGIRVLPNLEIYDLKGRHTTLPQLAEHKVLILDCWFIPCPPCFAEMGYLHRLYARYKSNPHVQLITLCRTDSGIVKKFLAKDPALKGFTDWYEQRSGRKDFLLPIYFIPGCNEKVGVYAKPGEPFHKEHCPDAQFKFRGYPTLMIFDKQGKLVFKETGFVKEQELAYGHRVETALQKALQAK